MVSGVGMVVVLAILAARKRILKEVHDRVTDVQLKTVKATLRSCWQPARMVITYFQVTAQLGPVLSMQYPPLFESAIASAAALLEVLDVFASGQCLGLDGFHYKWILQVVLMPLLMLLVVVPNPSIRVKDAQR